MISCVYSLWPSDYSQPPDICLIPSYNRELPIVQCDRTWPFSLLTWILLSCSNLYKQTKNTSLIILSLNKHFLTTLRFLVVCPKKIGGNVPIFQFYNFTFLQLGSCCITSWESGSLNLCAFIILPKAGQIGPWYNLHKVLQYFLAVTLRGAFWGDDCSLTANHLASWVVFLVIE